MLKKFTLHDRFFCVEYKKHPLVIPKNIISTSGHKMSVKDRVIFGITIARTVTSNQPTEPTLM